MGTKNNMKNNTLTKEKKTRNFKIYILIALFVLITIAVIVVIKAMSNPNLLMIIKSDEDIRNEMLELTPIGTEKKDVVEIIENHGEWYLNAHSAEKVLSVCVGEYTIFFKTTIEVIWDFDKELKVRKITVNRSTDTL
ncbi:MAG: hypothetical protein LBI03_01505 [Clostridiales bacterium]|jgi:hypothetical protein|nr:hypothetical protein [Clostridiales bacterium]